MNTFRKLALVALVLLAMAPPLQAQTTLNSTTLSAAITTADTQNVSLTSTTNVSAGDLLVVDGEAMIVRTVGSPTIVTRGARGTAAVPHVSGALVYSGVPARFYANDPPPNSACTRVQELYLPHVVLPSGKVWDCPTGSQAWTLLNDPTTLTARSVWFNLDNGSGTTIDDVILRPARPIQITAARIVYVDATTGTVAAGNAKIGTTVGGAEIVAATSYENTKAVGTTTAMTIVSGFVAAGTPVLVRHTGVAVTQAGQAYVEIDYHYR